MTDQDFLNHFFEKGFFKNHARVVLALSGGLDSMFLFYLLSTYRKELGIELVLAHINHKQRPESNDEENELRKLAKQAEIPIYIARFDQPFTEARARQFRYDFFREVMRNTSSTALVTAHHADDQVETIFMRLIRGVRLHHLSSIKERQKFDRGELIRPLLVFYKEEFPKVDHFEDMTNQENDYLRNRVRNLYLPQLEKENTQVKKAFLEFFNKQPEIISLLHDIQTDKPSFRPVIEPSDLQRVICVRAKLNNARISRQQGCFLLFGISGAKSPPAAIPNKWQRLASNRQKILVKAENKAAIIQELQSFGISKRTLFPELEAQATEIMDSYKGQK